MPWRANPAATKLYAVAGIIAALTIVRIAVAMTAGLAEDEAYYWLWSRHLSPGYFDHPPMVAVWIRAGTEIFGQTALGIRAAALVSSVLASLLIYATAKSLFRNRDIALDAVLWGNASLIFSAAAVIMTPDTPLVFFSLLALYALAKLIETGLGRWWYLYAAAAGCAFMSKYTAVLMIASTGLWMLASAEGRRWLLRRDFYLAAMLGIVIIAPVFWWNAQHDWASFAKQLHHGFKDVPKSALGSLGEFAGGQAGLVTPLIFGFCIWGMVHAAVRGWRERDARWLLVAAMSLPAFAFFTVHSLSEKIQQNWAGFIYAPAFIAATAAWHLRARSGRPAPWLRGTYAVAPAVALVFSLFTYAQASLALVALPPKLDPTSRLRGWDELGARVEALKAEHGAAFILTSRYAITGELAYHTTHPEDVIQGNERIRYSFEPLRDDAALAGQNALYVVKAKDAKNAPFASYFNDIVPLGELPRDAVHHNPDKYAVFLYKGYRGGLLLPGINGIGSQTPAPLR